MPNEGVEAAPSAPTVSVELPEGLSVTTDSGEAPAEILPPRPVTPPANAPADAVAVSIGSPTTQLNLSIPVVLQVTTIGGPTPPIIYLYEPSSTPQFVLGGIEDTFDGRTYTRGGVVLSRTALGGGKFQYVMGLLLNHFSTYVASDESPVPAIADLSPRTATAGGSDFTLTVLGANFVGGSAIQWNGASRPTGFAGSSRLTVTISSGDITSSRTVTVTVRNPTPGGGPSNEVPFTVNAGAPFRAFVPVWLHGYATDGW